MRLMLQGAGFTEIRITVKEGAADIIKEWMPGSGAEKYVTSVYVTAKKPTLGTGLRDVVQGAARPTVVVQRPVIVDTGAASSPGC